MATTQKTIWDAVKALLENNATLKAYVKIVYEGEREVANIPNTLMPCIMLGDWEYSRGPYETGFQQGELTIPIYGVISSLNSDVQIWGDAVKGVGDFKMDVESALFATYPTLGVASVENFTFSVTPRYATAEYPFRGFEAILKVMYEVAV